MLFLMCGLKVKQNLLCRVKSKRRCVGPNSGFLKQLLAYQSMGWTVNEKNIQYRLYRLSGAAFSLRNSYSVTKGM